MKYIAFKTLQRYENGATTILVQKGDVITRAKWNKLSEKHQDCYYPLGLDELVESIQKGEVKPARPKVKRKRKQSTPVIRKQSTPVAENKIDYTPYSNILADWTTL